MKLYALLIGINEYSPNSNGPIRPLQACLNDVANMKAFLSGNYADMIVSETQFLTLVNEQATRQNVINGFRNHLCQAVEGDVALVYYSGHGSYGITAPEFQKFTTDGQEQTWVLHDSREAGKYDLADKEIALLLEEAGRNHPHLVVIADSCHSGSITREVEEFRQMQPRFTSGTHEPRPLNTYLEGAYTRRSDLKIPATDHLLLAACERTERAWEADGQGQLTKALLSVLTGNGGQIPYADLFVQVRAAIRSSVENQTPQLETIGSFSTRQGFLGRNVNSSLLRRYRTYFDTSANHWKIELGADRGLEPSMGREMDITIFDSVSGGNPKETAKIKILGLTKSELNLQNTALTKEVTYWGEPAALTLIPFFVYGNTAATEVLTPILENAAEAGITFSEVPDACLFEVAVENNTLCIYDIRTRVMVQWTDGTDAEAARRLLEVLKQLARWHRLLDLKNPAAKISEADIALVINVRQNGSAYDCTESTVALEFDREEIPFEAVLTNNTHQKLYATLLYQSSRYGIQVLFEDSQPIVNQGSVTLVENTFVLDDANDEEIDTFKLLVSTEPIDSFLFQQDALPLGAKAQTTKGLGRGIGSVAKSDWLTKTTTIRIVRKGKQVAGREKISLGNGIEIHGHPDFRGNLNWTPLIPKTRSVTAPAIQSAYFADNPYLQIVNFSANARSVEDKSILEIGDIQQKEKLKEEPLVVTVQPKEGEALVLPMFFDGEDFLPLGKATVDEHGNLKLEITHIPDEKGEAKTRSLGSALRMVFVKFANKLGLKGETHQLRWVDYRDEAEAVRISEGLEEKVARARKVLLLIHGIIGDTEEMAETFRMALEKGYDLVLTYDYENLNTPIEENALILKNKLQAAGFGEKDGKELVLVVHSMGGLVARYLLERLGGEVFVDKLIMAGTPNGGSAFGNVPDYLNWASVTLGLGAKLFPPQAGAVAAFASGILKGFSKTLLPSLGQMKVGSPFIVDLAAGLPPKIPYRVIGGDLEAYLAANDSLPLMEKAVAQLGEWVYKGVKNDIAVSVDNIFNVRNTPAQKVPCHHLNYFVTPVSVKALAEAIE